MALKDLLEAAAAKDSTAVATPAGHLIVTVDGVDYDLGSISSPVTDDDSYLVTLTEVLSSLATASGGSGDVTVTWADVSGKPTFSDVATSGSYADLSDTPAEVTWSNISGKPTVVASGTTQAAARSSIGAGTSSFSGSYSDLTGKPTLGTAASQDSSAFATAAQGSTADSAVQPGDLATVATSGSYDDLTDKPASTPTAWDDVTDKPTFATVATSGSYTDLADKPTIPAAQVQTDWEASSGLASIANKPTLGTAAAQDVSAFATAAQGATADNAVQPGDLADYAKTADVPTTAADVDALPASLGSTTTSNVVVVANGSSAPAGLPDGTVIVELSS